MCGICGVFDLDGGPACEDEVRAMNGAMALRGPDDEGVHLDGPAGLGHRRLSIIDLQGGHQPLTTDDGEIAALCNGEIYNHLDLRAELSAAGHRFRTRSDSEVIVHGYRQWGESVVERLDGMFAFAVWDRRRRRMFLGRDRFGKKPLAWFVAGRRFVFASTLTALLRHPAAPRAIDREALARYLALEFVPAPKTIIGGIEKLPPASTLTVGADGRVERRRYWSLEVRGAARPPSRAEAEETIRELLDAAVKRRLMSDVPLGVFLSGGIDSSSVVASAAALGARPIRTFSIGFSERSFDETGYARTVARHFATEHVEERLAPQAMLEIVPRLGAILDEPMADGSIVPTYLLSRLARRHVTVALGGDGGDELFAGYPMYVAHRLAEATRLVPRPLLALAERAAAKLPVSHRNMSLDFKLKKTLEGLRYPLAVRNYVWLGAFAPDRLGDVLAEPLPDPEALVRPVEEAYRDAPGATHLEKVLYQDVGLYLCHQILCKVDRASMANSLEVRAPLLDTRLAEYVARLPLAMKLDGLEGKSVLKSAMATRLPRKILYRPKKGFGMPVGEWLRGPLRPLAEELLLDGAGLTATGLFRREGIRALLDEHRRGVVDHRKRLWSLMVFELWRREHLA